MIYSDLTKKALRICFDAHKGQTDMSGVPYVFHPFHIAERMNDEMSVCTALLHEVVEDNEITINDLKENGFPEEVIQALELLNNKNEDYNNYIKKIMDNPIARKVKIEDLKHDSNLTRLSHVRASDIERTELYIRTLSSLAQPNLRSRIKGCLLGGAAGDALGYSVEFLNEGSIFAKYQGGICEYSLSSGRKALISDDTQMTLFTTCALVDFTHYQSLLPRTVISEAYQQWLLTQECSFYEASDLETCFAEDDAVTALMSIPAMFNRRAPGTTCLSALAKRRDSKVYSKSYIEHKINNSKGCGGVMRAAPIGFLPNYDIKELDIEAAETAAYTHSHSLGYMPAAILVHIIHKIAYRNEETTLKQIIEDARDTVAKIFAADEHIGELTDIINLALKLSENSDSDLDNIHRIGEGWVGDEALAIAIYCALKYQDDFSKGIIAAVNHKGDSDSTGAITGNILGTWIGFEKIEQKWKDDLELYSVILKTADKLYKSIQPQ